MSKYCTTTSLSTVLVDADFSVESALNLAQKCILSGEREIDKRLSRRYDMSLFNSTASIPPMVSELCERLAEGYWWRRNSRGGKETLKRGNDIVAEAVDCLNDLRDRKADLLDINGSVISEKTETNFRIISNTTEYAQTFDEDDPLDWVQDPDKLDDIESGRL